MKACNEYTWLAICVNSTLRHLLHFDTRKKNFWERLLKTIEANCTFGGNK